MNPFIFTVIGKVVFLIFDTKLPSVVAIKLRNKPNLFNI